MRIFSFLRLLSSPRFASPASGRVTTRRRSPSTPVRRRSSRERGNGGGNGGGGGGRRRSLVSALLNSGRRGSEEDVKVGTQFVCLDQKTVQNNLFILFLAETGPAARRGGDSPRARRERLQPQRDGGGAEGTPSNTVPQRISSKVPSNTAIEQQQRRRGRREEEFGSAPLLPIAPGGRQSDASNASSSYPTKQAAVQPLPPHAVNGDQIKREESPTASASAASHRRQLRSALQVPQLWGPAAAAQRLARGGTAAAAALQELHLPGEEKFGIGLRTRMLWKRRRRRC